MENTDKKTAVITGSTRGIGLAIAEKFAAEGYRVVISGRNEERVKNTVNKFLENDFEALGVAADVSIYAEAEMLIKKTIEAYGNIDVLVNNAGITRDNLIMRMSEEEWDEVIRVNLKGVYNCSKAVTRPMMKKRKGVIINITSIVGEIGNAGQANYAASKAGIIGFTKSMAKELASRDIRVNAVAPGFIKTDMTDQLTEAQVDTLKAQIPLRRLGEGSDVANLVAFLASDDASYITGQVVNVDGGMVI